MKLRLWLSRTTATPRRSIALLLLASVALAAIAPTVLGASAATAPAAPSAIFTELGFARQTLNTPAGELVYYEAGTGQPLVFLHGIGGGASSWTWSKTAPAFVDEYRVIVPDWVGWGASEHPARYLLFDDYTAQLDALLNEIDEPAFVVAQTASAGFAADIARSHPDAFAGLIFMTPSGGIEFGENVTDPFFAATFTTIARTEVVNRAFYDLVFHRPEFIRFFFTGTGYDDPSAVGEDVVTAYTNSARIPNSAYAALPFLAGDVQFDFATYLTDLDVPAAIVWGANEREIGADVRDRLAALRPDLPLVLIPNSSLSFELERPSETAQALRWLLDGFQALETP